MKDARSSTGSVFGNANFDADAVRMRRDFNRVVSIIAYDEVKVIARNGIMFRQIRSELAWSSKGKIGHIKVF